MLPKRRERLEEITRSTSVKSSAVNFTKKLTIVQPLSEVTQALLEESRRKHLVFYGKPHERSGVSSSLSEADAEACEGGIRGRESALPLKGDAS